MAKKAKSRYVCNSCGAISATWAGRCYQCGEWNTLSEQVEIDTKSLTLGGHVLQAESVKTLSGKNTGQRINSGIDEVDMVLGGGFVAGSVVLIAGQPGIGKSTLLLQIADRVAARHPVLYIFFGEYAPQIRHIDQKLGAGLT